jgi:prepilin-type N-terminal cleavage/methylation domain-containing protein
MKDNKGFTLIELLIVVAIIGIIAAVSIPAYVGQQTRAARVEGYKNLEAIRLFEEQFFAENASYTADFADMPGFQAGQYTRFTYAITTEVAVTTPIPIPYAGGTAAQTNCFVATATGNAGRRVDGDVFVIDCNNNKNY